MSESTADVSRVCNHRTVNSNWNVSLMQLSNVWANVSQRSTSARSRRSLHAFFVKCMHTTMAAPSEYELWQQKKQREGRSKVQSASIRADFFNIKEAGTHLLDQRQESSSNSGTRLKASSPDADVSLLQRLDLTHPGPRRDDHWKIAAFIKLFTRLVLGHDRNRHHQRLQRLVVHRHVLVTTEVPF